MVSGLGGSRVCACVCSVSASMQNVQLQRPVPDCAGHRTGGLEGKARGRAVECSSSRYLLNTSSCWAVTFPSCPRLLEQKSLGPPVSLASARAD